METNEVLREKQVPRYMAAIRSNLEQIESSLSVLQDNLSSVLKDDLLSADASNQDEATKLVPFACELRDFDHRMKIILSSISYMNEALEL